MSDVIAAVKLLQDDNRLCDVLASTTPAEDAVILAARLRIDTQMKRRGMVEPGLLDADTANTILRAADVVRRAYERISGRVLMGAPGGG